MNKIVSKREIKKLYDDFRKLTSYENKVSFYLKNKLGIRRNINKSYKSDTVLDLYYASGEIEESLPEDYFTFELEYPLFRSFDLSFSENPQMRIDIIPTSNEEHFIFWNNYFNYLEHLLPLEFLNIKENFQLRLKTVRSDLKLAIIESEIQHEENYFNNLPVVNKQIVNDFKRGIELAKIVYAYYCYTHNNSEYLPRIYDIIDVIKNMTQDEYFTIIELRARNNYLTFLHFLKEKIDDHVNIQIDSNRIWLKWDGSKSQLYSLFKQLKEKKLISNSYEELASFIMNNVESFNNNKLSTITAEIKRNKNLTKGKRIYLIIK